MPRAREPAPSSGKTTGPGSSPGALPKSEHPGPAKPTRRFQRLRVTVSQRFPASLPPLTPVFTFRLSQRFNAILPPLTPVRTFIGPPRGPRSLDIGTYCVCGRHAGRPPLLNWRRQGTADHNSEREGRNASPNGRPGSSPGFFPKSEHPRPAKPTRRLQRLRVTVSQRFVASLPPLTPVFTFRLSQRFVASLPPFTPVRTFMGSPRGPGPRYGTYCDCGPPRRQTAFPHNSGRPGIRDKNLERRGGINVQWLPPPPVLLVDSRFLERLSRKRYL